MIHADQPGEHRPYGILCTAAGGCRLHGLCGVDWGAWYACSVCGCGGSLHGVYRAPDDHRAAKPVQPGEVLFCWAHRPRAMTLGLVS